MMGHHRLQLNQNNAQHYKIKDNPIRTVRAFSVKVPNNCPPKSWAISDNWNSK